MRGDRPPFRCATPRTWSFTPHARGSTLPYSEIPHSASVYPACAGIDLRSSNYNIRSCCLPRMRGDRPCKGGVRPSLPAFTPHARGSTLEQDGEPEALPVYPACAGIDRGRFLVHRPVPGLPRMRGDRPHLELADQKIAEFTPHARGSTSLDTLHSWLLFVYPACAGIDRCRPTWCRLTLCLPRMRGDRPIAGRGVLVLMTFTPHARGSTY